jgi:hypothetical protein
MNRKMTRKRRSLHLESLEDRRVLSASSLAAVSVTIEAPTLSLAIIHVEDVLSKQELHILEKIDKHLDHAADVLQRVADKLEQHHGRSGPFADGDDHGPPPWSNGNGGNSSNGNPGNSGNGDPGNGNSGNGNSGNGGGVGGAPAPSTPGLPPIRPPVVVAPQPTEPEPTPSPAPGDGEAPAFDAPTSELSFVVASTAEDARFEADGAPTARETTTSQGPATLSERAALVDAGSRFVEENEARLGAVDEAQLNLDDEPLPDAVVPCVQAPAGEAGALQIGDLAPVFSAALDLEALDAALLELRAGFDQISQRVAESIGRSGLTVWLTAAAVGMAAVEGARRRLRRRLIAANLTEDPALTWVPGMPGSFSVEEQ